MRAMSSSSDSVFFPFALSFAFATTSAPTSTSFPSPSHFPPFFLSFCSFNFLSFSLFTSFVFSLSALCALFTASSCSRTLFLDVESETASGASSDPLAESFLGSLDLGYFIIELE
ncbi:hypothetical protein BDQ17DRAFT_1382555 [Cyathus striatus]|nr:hypothetical protein BDQ17DRAFT_1382555 [Cyathus striatus]